MNILARGLHRIARWCESPRWRNGAVATPRPVRDAALAALGPGSVLALNVGARWGDAGAWWRVDPLVRMVGFEPDAAECTRLNALSPDPHAERYVPLALGSSARDGDLHLTQDPACSSLYPPIASLIGRYPDLGAIRPVGTVPVRLTTLDDWWDAEQRPVVSFLKIDTQGSELDILRGAEALLPGCAGCEVEVEFSPLYHGQPLFGDVDSFLRDRGFVLWRLRDLLHYSEQRSLSGANGRLFWGNAIYLRDYRELGAGAADRRMGLVLAALLEALDDHAAARSCLESAHPDGIAARPAPPPQNAAAIAAD